MKGSIQVRAFPLLTLGAVIAVLWVTGCKQNIQSDEAVKQGIQAYLAKRPDLLSMDVNVTAVTYRQDEATATVHFQAKGDKNPATGMTMQYVLERKGNQWAVKGRAGSGPHGPENTGMPQGARPSPEGTGSIGAMPNTTPPGGSGASPSGALPPGHPAIPTKPGQSK